MKNIDSKIQELQDILETDPFMLTTPELLHALKNAYQLLRYLFDENASLWAMLDEQKASDIENHKALVKEELNRKINETFKLMSNKVADA